MDLPPLKLEQKLSLYLIHGHREGYLIFYSKIQNKKCRERIFKDMKKRSYKQSFSSSPAFLKSSSALSVSHVCIFY